MDGEKIEKLILLVHEYEELYVMSNKNYSNQNRREVIWVEIGKKINESGEVCKKKWKTLRDAFQKAAKNNQTKSGQAATNSKKWKYWDAMSFLLPHIKGRETHSNVWGEEVEHHGSEGEGRDNESETDNNTQSQLEDDLLENITSPLSSLSRPNSPLSSSSSVVTPLSRAASSAKRATLKKTTKSMPQKGESLPEILQEYVQDKKRNRMEKAAARQSSTDDKNSALLDFFTSMAKTTATFPPLWQAKVKNGLFDIISSYEVALLETSSSPLPPPVSTESYKHIQQKPSMQNQPPLQALGQNAPPMQIQPSMQTHQPLIQNQQSISSYTDPYRPLYSSQAPSAEYYATFASNVSAAPERNSGQNIVIQTTEALDMARESATPQQENTYMIMD